VLASRDRTITQHTQALQVAESNLRTQAIEQEDSLARVSDVM